MSTEYYTVVYRVDGDRAQHDSWWQALRPLFFADGLPISVVIVALGDLVTRLDYELESAAEARMNAPP
jgi:hypothetical protein